MKLGFITTSRADFGIYIPLLRQLEREAIGFRIFAGGMHTSSKFGYSYKLIEEEYEFAISEKVESLTNDDTNLGIAQSMGSTTFNFSSVWEKYHSELDLVFTLGDRFEMFSAALSLVPFNIAIAHLHGGETTLGAIDDKLRHALTAISDYHFASTSSHAKRVEQIKGSGKNVYNVGALGIDGIAQTTLFTSEEFLRKFAFNISEPFVLVTYHPETVELNNEYFINELIIALKQIPYHILCTLPNADTQGDMIRRKLVDFQNENPGKIACYENLGQKGYYTAMKNCVMVIGNSSSGIIEAASFNKPVINIGNRQLGRTSSENVLHAENKSSSILAAIDAAGKFLLNKEFINLYGDGRAAVKIVEILKEENL